MDRKTLVERIYTTGSYLCIGLDSERERLPACLRNDPDAVFSFNRAIIDATADLCVAYKINTAFYESWGARGWETMERTVRHIPDTHFRIADAKRGDIGNTSAQYARAFLEALPFDAVTIAPYMGSDSVKPFLRYEGKWGIVLGLTSNAGAADFEMKRLATEDSPRLYEEVMRTAATWGDPGNLMFVVGATQAGEFERIREIVPEHFLLVPGVGAQGGSLEEISKKAMTADGGLLVNASRSVIFASDGADFAEAARAAAEGCRTEMLRYLLPRIGRIGREPL